MSNLPGDDSALSIEVPVEEISAENYAAEDPATSSPTDTHVVDELIVLASTATVMKTPEIPEPTVEEAKHAENPENAVEEPAPTEGTESVVEGEMPESVVESVTVKTGSMNAAAVDPATDPLPVFRFPIAMGGKIASFASALKNKRSISAWLDASVRLYKRLVQYPQTDQRNVSLVQPPAPSDGDHTTTRLPKRSSGNTLERRRLIVIGLLALLLLGIIVPLIIGASYAISAYTTYTALRTRASSGAQHLLDVKNLFTGSKGHLTNALETGTLSQANKDFVQASKDFSQVQNLLDHTPVISVVTQYLPQYRPQVSAARTASQIGIDASHIGQDLIATALKLAPAFRGPLLDNAKTPLITSAELKAIGVTINQVLPLVDHIQRLSRTFSVDVLPVSTHQREQVQQLFQMLPQVEDAMKQGQSYLDALGWLLGVDGPRTFLVQTMDRAELRATGGFTGQYGELQVDGGRVAPFSLRDISLVEYTDNSPTSAHVAPAAYRSWWPFANWGLRDSNLSADFPTSAQIAINQYEYEVHHHVDGVILFTPFLIEHVLKVTGPIQIPSYNETITAQNLEARLHYYQLDNAGIAKQLRIQGGDKSTSERKQFTSLVAHTLMDHMRHASLNELLAVAQAMLYDLKTRDLQIYLANPQLEDFLMQHNDAAQVDLSTSHDGLYVVQANVSASKASQYVKTTMHDTVTLDATGGATHVLQLRLAYNQIGPVYGLDTYRDYVRIYVPPTATLLWGDGFDTGTALCGGVLDACPQDGVYPGGELACPTGQYDAGWSAPMLNDPYDGEQHPLDKIGPPTNQQSDEPGRAMFGGYIIVPKNCMMTASLSWYVPPTGRNSYTLLVQRQAGTFPEFDLTVLPASNACASATMQGMHVDGILTEDTTYSLLTTRHSYRNAVDCYPQPGV